MSTKQKEAEKHGTIAGSTEKATIAPAQKTVVETDARDKDAEVRALAISTPFPHNVRGDGVVIVQDAPPTRSEGGLVLIDSRESTPLSGVVIGLGPGKRHENGELEVPDFEIKAHVSFGNYAGSRLTFEHCGAELVLLHLDEVRVVLKDKA